jgi:exodeoxyribonuclease VII large subunit
MPRRSSGSPRQAQTWSATTEKGISLTDLMAKVKGVIDRGMPDAVWVRAEVSELRGKNGHLYLTLTERNERGDVLVNSKGIIWRSLAEPITRKFVQATGEGLKTDIKILCLVRVRFDPYFGLDLIIEDVDPSYTLGDLAAKLARIREWLVKDLLYERNRSLSTPFEFVRVVVISPETSAGLGDFRRETDRLHEAGLCTFLFFGATFQGIDAPSSIRTAVNEALAAHRQRPFDAMVVIRGGGSVTDLAWLNDLELARLICRAPIPVFTGIGHERDSTILDEIAHRRFDTPSKVALHITQTIRDNAIAALSALDRINSQMDLILTRERNALANQAERLQMGVRSVREQAECDPERFMTTIRTAVHYRLREEMAAIDTQAERIKTGVKSVVRQAENDRREFMATIRTTTDYQIREANLSLDAGYAGLVSAANQAIRQGNIDLKQSMEGIAHRTQLQLGEREAAIEKAADSIALQAKARIEAASRDLDHMQSQIVAGTASICQDARGQVEAFARLVVGLGPQATLQRGFSIAKDGDDRPITSREAAMRSEEFAVQFHDGGVRVANKDLEEMTDERGSRTRQREL